MPPKVQYPIDLKKYPEIIPDNPVKFYSGLEEKDGEDIGKGKFAITRRCVHKLEGTTHAAKIIKFDSDSLKFAIREYDFMKTLKLDHSGDAPVHPGLVELKEAYLVRRYLILIMDIADGPTMLDFAVKRHTLNEDSVAMWIKQLCEVLSYMHANNALHLDIRPTNIRFDKTSGLLKLVDYNACRFVANKKAGAVVDVIGDTEFCAPEMLDFEPVQPGSDMWSVAIITYILLSGMSPFFYEDEDEVVNCVKKVKWNFDPDKFANITSEAKDFISKCLIRAPESRLTASDAVNHTWLSDDYGPLRKKSALDQVPADLEETDERLYSEEEEEYIWGEFKFFRYDEADVPSPEESEEEDD